MSATTTPSLARKVVVIGAGIVGTSAALCLRRDGHEVTLLDPLPPGEGASFGNAGGIVLSYNAPVAMPGIWKQVPRMLFDPLGPLSLRWSYLPRLAPWLLRFLAASTPARVEKIAGHKAALLSAAGDAWRDLLRLAGNDGLVEQVGWLGVWETDKGFAGEAFAIELMRRHDCPFEILDENELRQLEPSLGRQFRHAVFQPGSMAIRHPHKLVQGFAQQAADSGVRVLCQRVVGFEQRGGRRHVLTEAGETHAADTVVVAAGAWSGRVCEMLGERVSLDTERGYHLMLPTPEHNLHRPVISAEHSFVLSPMQHGLRMTSGVELAGLDAPADFRRIRRMLPLAQQMLPGLETDVQSEWLGFRPSMPDSMPVLGRSRRHADVVYAFGHGHLGMTMGPISGQVVADLVSERVPGIDLSAFAPR